MTIIKSFTSIAAVLAVSALVLSSCAGEKSPEPAVPAAEGAGPALNVSSEAVIEETTPTAAAVVPPAATDAATTESAAPVL